MKRDFVDRWGRRLEVASSVEVIDTPQFPAASKAEAASSGWVRIKGSNLSFEKPAHIRERFTVGY